MKKFNYYTGITECGALKTDYVWANSIEEAKENIHKSGCNRGYISTCAEIIDEYKGYEILIDCYKTVTAYDKRNKTRFVVALDDSSSERIFVAEYNNVESAKKYIDILTSDIN